MMKPDTDKNRFDQIFYFKDNFKLDVPRQLVLGGKNEQIMGYGFFKYTEKLIPEIASLPPLYYPYDPYSEKLKRIASYNNLKSSSLIRLETNDFTDFKEDKPNIYIADNEFAKVPAALDFLKEYSNSHKFKFFYPMVATMENFEDFYKYINLIDKAMFVKEYNEDFFREHCTKKGVNFSYSPREDEDRNNHLKRMIKMTLYFKSHQIKPEIDYLAKLDTLEYYIVKWALSKVYVSYVEHYKDNKKALDYLPKVETEIRLLLKSNPLTINTRLLDL